VNVSVLCTNTTHPVVPALQRWQGEMTARGHEVALLADRSELTSGDVLFLVSCRQMVTRALRDRFRRVFVLHASDLPKGRGMSPHVWAIANGADRVCVSLMEAADTLDTGDVWLKTWFSLDGHELLPEINAKLFAAELELMTRAVEEFATLRPAPQRGEAEPYLRARTPEDSRLDPHKTLAEQFDLLRVVDNTRYPAFMDHRGHRYVVRIEKAADDERR
jgi:methionyl-tRNA formyltransferase